MQRKETQMQRGREGGQHRGGSGGAEKGEKQGARGWAGLRIILGEQKRGKSAFITEPRKKGREDVGTSLKGKPDNWRKVGQRFETVAKG